MKPIDFVLLVGEKKAKQALKAPMYATHINSKMIYFTNRLADAKGWFRYDDVSDCWVDENPSLKQIVKLSDLSDFIILAECS